MNMNQFQYKGINLIGGYQCWSNPSISGSEKAIPIILSRPTFLDLMMLSFEYGVDNMLEKNDELLKLGEISTQLHDRNENNLKSIKTGIAND